MPNLHNTKVVLADVSAVGSYQSSRTQKNANQESLMLPLTMTTLQRQQCYCKTRNIIIKTDMQKSFLNLITSAVLASPYFCSLLLITNLLLCSSSPASCTLFCDMQKQPKVNSAVFVREFFLLLPSDNYLILFSSLFILREPVVTCG